MQVCSQRAACTFGCGRIKTESSKRRNQKKPTRIGSAFLIQNFYSQAPMLTVMVTEPEAAAGMGAQQLFAASYPSPA